jgi:1,4-dihydroxy-2-naphthoate octaprenyltransferase
MTNNIRDIPTDTQTGKRTLAVRIGAPQARLLYAGCMLGALVAVIGAAVLAPWSLIALLAGPLAVPPIRLVRTRHDPPGLVAALLGTARFGLVLAILLAFGLWLS